MNFKRKKLPFKNTNIYNYQILSWHLHPKHFYNELASNMFLSFLAYLINIFLRYHTRFCPLAPTPITYCLGAMGVKNCFLTSYEPHIHGQGLAGWPLKQEK